MKNTDHVILVLMLAQVLDQRGTPRALLLQPFNLVGAAVRIVVDPVRVPVEGLLIARSCVGESADGHTAHAIRALRILVPPRDVVAGAGRQHLDLVLPAQAFGDQPAQLLRAAEHFGAVALNDDGDVHADVFARRRGAGARRKRPAFISHQRR